MIGRWLVDSRLLGLDRILTISRVVIARIRGDPETRANLEMNGGGPIKIGAF